jgi:agmatinase
MNSKASFIDFCKQCLRAPGDGVFTVSNAKEKRESLQKSLYGTHLNVQELWLNTLKKNLSENFDQTVVLGICSDTGGGIQRGANWGPLFLRQHLYKNQQCDILDLGDTLVIPQLLHDKYLNAQTIRNVRQSVYGDSDLDLPVSPLSIAQETAKRFYASFPNAKIFGLGGDHSVSYPLVKAWLESAQRQHKKVGLIHFDAHTDLMLERLGIDLCFGSWVPPLIKYFSSPSHIFQIGIRSSAQERTHWEKSFGVKQLWAHEIKELGLKKSLDLFSSYLAENKFDEVYISFDIDALDILYAPATGTPEADGLAPHEAKLFLDIIGENCRVSGADMVEVAPYVNTTNDLQAQETTLVNAALLSQALIDLLARS